MVVGRSVPALEPDPPYFTSIWVETKLLIVVDEENLELEALRAIQNEGTRAEVAQGFREQGNENAKAKLWRDGKEFYTKGIGVLNAKEDKWDRPEDINQEQRLARQVAEACYINRALCNLELSTISLSAGLRPHDPYH